MGGRPLLLLMALTSSACAGSHRRPGDETEMAPEPGDPPEPDEEQDPREPEARCVLTVRLNPVARAQLAIWVETEDGARMQTLLLTEAVGLRGIGNRPGAEQLNSGFRFPYGRRESVLPSWASARGARGEPFARIVFQDRREGFSDRTANDHSPDPYFCLPFNVELTRRDGLDAVSCASPFRGDKGRYLAPYEVNYAQPKQVGGIGMMERLSPGSPYPPRRDVEPCDSDGCFDHPDLARFAADALEVMPELDAVTRATLAAEPAELDFALEPDWHSGRIVLFVEVNTEGDYNHAYNPDTLPTPTLPEDEWDSWAVSYGYPYRGQPAVVFELPLGEPGANVGLDRPTSYARDGLAGPPVPVDEAVTDDPEGAPGSGADRLRADADGIRLSAVRSGDCD